MSVKFPYGSANELLILADGGTVSKTIENNNTIITTEELTDNVTLNLVADENLQIGTILTIFCLTNGTETFTFGGGVYAPTVNGVAGKIWSQSFIYNGVNFYPTSVHSFEESTCPTITIGENQESGIIFIDESGPLAALISGGEPGYTIGTITGTIPSGFDLRDIEIDGDYYVILDGSATTFGSYTFSVTVLDANNCESTPRTFTIEVWAGFANKTPQVVTISDPFLITVYEFPLIYGSGVALDSITLNYTSAVGSFPNIEDPNGDFTAHLYNSPAIGDVTDAVIYDITEAYPQFATGSTPYEGSFISGSDSFTEFDGSAVNGDWKIRGVDGTINAVGLVFKPL